MDTNNDAILTLLSRFEETWNHHDAKSFSHLFARDADFTNVFGQSATGQQEIEQFHAPMFSSMFKASQLQITEKKIRFVRPDVAAVDAWWTMTGAVDTDGFPWPDRKGLMNLIICPENESWVIVVMHNMDL